MGVAGHLCLLLLTIVVPYNAHVRYSPLVMKKNPPADGHRCGVCPTYFQKICAFDVRSNRTFIFDNHCIMDLHNCVHGTEFCPMAYDNCVYFGSFAYVHGYKVEDNDYGERYMSIHHSKKNPDFA